MLAVVVVAYCLLVELGGLTKKQFAVVAAVVSDWLTQILAVGMTCLPSAGAVGWMEEEVAAVVVASGQKRQSLAAVGVAFLLFVEAVDRTM